MKLLTSSLAVATALWQLATVYPGSARQGVPHLERCTKWTYFNGHFGTSNACDFAVSVRFMTKRDQRVIELELGPGRNFNTGLSRAQIGSDWWMFTTCPIGYASDVPFRPENSDTIIASKYRCVGK